jgi:hypothetical protein
MLVIGPLVLRPPKETWFTPSFHLRVNERAMRTAIFRSPPNQNCRCHFMGACINVSVAQIRLLLMSTVRTALRFDCGRYSLALAASELLGVRVGLEFLRYRFAR